MSLNSDSSVICKICNQTISKYTCPRCNIQYCSVTCYKSELHLQCSESFYRECITEEMSSVNTDSESKTKMLEILKKMKEYNEQEDVEDAFDDEQALSEKLDSDDDDPVPDLAVRLQNVNLDNCDDVWELLTEDEKKEFESLLNGDITQIVPNWKPWWLFHKPLLSEIQNDDEQSYENSCPTIIIAKLFSSIAKVKPAPCVKYNLINALSAYAYTARLFNGDHHNMITEATSCLLCLSSNLSKGTNYENVETAVNSVVLESYNNDSFSISTEGRKLIESDLKDMIEGPESSNKLFYIKCALSDAHALLKKFLKLDKDNATKSTSRSKFPYREAGDRSIDRDKVKTANKKIEYYLSMITEYGYIVIDAMFEYGSIVK